MGHSFKLESNANSGNKSKADYSLIFMIFFILVAVVCIIVYFIISNNGSSSMAVEKINEDKKYVYTYKKIQNLASESDDTIYDKVPAINLIGDKYTQINNQIITNYNFVVSKGVHDYEYKYNESDGLLSLVIRSSYYNNENDTYIQTHFNTYNIDLKTNTILTNSDLLDRYNVTTDQIKTFLKAKFTNYYNELIKYQYFKKTECDYNCFLKNRGLTSDYMKNVSFYVDKGKLTLFKFYYRDSKYDEAQYFDDTTYQFLIKE